MALSLLDPLRAGAVWRDRVAHEAGHVTGALRLGFRFDVVRMDRFGDDGWWGAVSGVRRLSAAIPEPDLANPHGVRAWLEAFENAQYRDALDRSVVARIGVMCTLGDQPWSGPGAGGDREIVASCRPRGWQLAAWELIVEDAAARLLRSEGFRLELHAVADDLERAGELSFDEAAALVR